MQLIGLTLLTGSAESPIWINPTQIRTVYVVKGIKDGYINQPDFTSIDLDLKATVPVKESPEEIIEKIKQIGI